MDDAVKLDLPDVPPSPNRLRGVHWAKKKKIADYWKGLVRSQVIPERMASNDRMKVRITIYHAREYDQDNAYASVKPLVDALKHWRLIYDDSPAWIKLEVEQGKCTHKQRHTLVEVKPI